MTFMIEISFPLVMEWQTIVAARARRASVQRSITVFGNLLLLQS